MRYAITYDNEQVFQHFGKCPSFMIVEISDKNFFTKDILLTHGTGHGALVEILVHAHVDTLVCGGIGQGAIDALLASNISLISGAKGHIDIILNKLMKHTLYDDPNGRCNHHHEGEVHHCESHNCNGRE